MGKTMRKSELDSIFPKRKADSVRQDMKEFPIYVLSGYSIGSSTPNVYAGDISPEELRWKAYQAQMSGNLQEYMQFQQNAFQEIERKKQIVQRNPEKTVEEIRNVLAGRKNFKSIFSEQNTGFGATSSPAASAFGSSTQQNNAFGAAAPQTSAFGSAFGAASTASPFRQQSTSAFGAPSAFASPNPTAFGNTTSSFANNPASVFGSQTTNPPPAFGATSFGAAANQQSSIGNTGNGFSFNAFQSPQTNSAFNTKPGTSAFGASPAANPPTTFGKTSTTSNQPAAVFGQSSFPSASAFGSSAFGQTSAFGSVPNTNNTGNTNPAQKSAFSNTPSGAFSFGGAASSFGQSSSKPSAFNEAASVFGNSANTNAPNTSAFATFGNTQNAQQQQAASVFGSTNNTQQAAPTSAFGASQQQQNPPTAGTASGFSFALPTAASTNISVASSAPAATPAFASSNPSVTDSSIPPEFLEQFQKPQFTIGHIPTVPPPPQFCQ
ncbi:nuclear rim protein Amo1 [Schizosaccharomyces japonicus yFS275]|uniref:Nuclear rim protein Amo1 n=1 Tax=Schizosaccharomyces japonicus (strain yFS275 / FY16936) TaxID=402676 RepID=B6K3B9_SCHJY|nr:nuclear rim protein Amo1 [Schizosaccharomyces japonicus yFS275]EEB07976.1 nuclear rim protein Amo1 [Schizosaccharomyces japonicus yFS275]